MAGKYRLSQEVPDSLDLSTLGSGAPGAKRWPGKQEDTSANEGNSPSSGSCWDIPFQIQGQGQSEAASIP